MSLEQAIATLTAAVEALTAKVSGASVSAKAEAAEKPAKAEAAEKPAAGKAKAAPAKAKGPVNTREAMQALLATIKADIGIEAARGVIKDAAGVAKQAEIPEDKIDAVFDAAKALLEAQNEDASDDDNGDGI